MADKRTPSGDVPAERETIFSAVRQIPTSPANESQKSEEAAHFQSAYDTQHAGVGMLGTYASPFFNVRDATIIICYAARTYDSGQGTTRSVRVPEADALESKTASAFISCSMHSHVFSPLRGKFSTLCGIAVGISGD